MCAAQGRTPAPTRYAIKAQPGLAFPESAPRRLCSRCRECIRTAAVMRLPTAGPGSGQTTWSITFAKPCEAGEGPFMKSLLRVCLHRGIRSWYYICVKVMERYGDIHHCEGSGNDSETDSRAPGIEAGRSSEVLSAS